MGVMRSGPGFFFFFAIVAIARKDVQGLIFLHSANPRGWTRLGSVFSSGYGKSEPELGRPSRGNGLVRDPKMPCAGERIRSTGGDSGVA